jgi:hypothetical protein
MRATGAGLALLMATSCTHVESSEYRTGPTLPAASGAVAISATRDPASGQELGIVEAHGRRTDGALEAIVAEFRARVASMGGDYGRIDRFDTKHEMVTESYTYDCGTTETSTETRSVYQPGPNGTGSFTTQTVPVTRHVPKTCTGQREVEAATLTVVGRAFRAAKATP